MSNLAIDQVNSEWAAAPGTGDGALIGRNNTSLVGFFGSVPVARPVIPAASAAEDIAAALVALGLVSQAAS